MEPSRWIGWCINSITSISQSQKKVRGCEGREPESFYSLNEWLFFARMFSSLIYFLTWSKIHSSSSPLPGHIRVTLHSFPLISSALESFTCAVVIVKVLTVSVWWKLFCLNINRSFCQELTIHTCILRNCRTIQASKIMRSRIVDQRTLLFGRSLISLPLKVRENLYEARGKD